MRKNPIGKVEKTRNNAEVEYPFGLGSGKKELNQIQNISIHYIGQPTERKEDNRLVTGQGRFTDDFHEQGQAYAAILRSPLPHAEIVSIDVKAALEYNHVLAVFTGADVVNDGLKPVPHNPVPKTKYDMKLTAPDGGQPFIGPHHLLAEKKVRHVGEAVAMVVAESRNAAISALELIEVDYKELPFCLDAKEAIKDKKNSVWDEVPDNVLVDTRFGDIKKTDTAFEGAAHVVEREFHINRVTGVPLEPRSALGSFDQVTERYSLIAGSGGAVRQKAELAEVLNISPEMLRVQSHDVGGNFGTRNRVYVEFALVLWASRRLKRPVKFTATRSEAFLTDYQGRDLHTKVALALDDNGKFLAMRADNISNVGARCVSLSALSKGSGLITGSYDIPVASLRARAVFTNTMSTQAYRSSGRPEVTYAIERLIEVAAEHIGMDALELRKKNLISPNSMPYRNAVGSVYDSGDYKTNMDRATKLADWDTFDTRKKDAYKRGKLLGRGFANYVESSIGSPKERAEITVNTNERLEVVIGTQPSGQGHETSFSQVVADILQVPVNKIDIRLGDTDVVTVGGGSHSGRSMRHAGTVMAMASIDLIMEAKRRAAKLLKCSVDKIDYTDGRFQSLASNLKLSLFDIHRKTQVSHGSLSAKRTNEMHDPVFPNGTAICEVEIDSDTFDLKITRYTTVDDVGRCINPMIVHGQTHGGIAQGVGQAILEDCAIDINSGQPIAGSFMDYGIPRATTLPFINAEIAEIHSPTNPLGIKAGGEGGTTPALATVVLAVLDALKKYDVKDISMPITPQRIWSAVRIATKENCSGRILGN